MTEKKCLLQDKKNVKLSHAISDLEIEKDCVLDMRKNKNILIGAFSNNKKEIFSSQNEWENFVENIRTEGIELYDIKNSLKKYGVKSVTVGNDYYEYTIEFEKNIKVCINNVGNNLVILDIHKIICNTTYEFFYDQKDGTEGIDIFIKDFEFIA